METVNLMISSVYNKPINCRRVIEIKLDSVKSPIGTRAMFTKGTKVMKVMNKKGRLVNIEDLRKGDIIQAIVGV